MIYKYSTLKKEKKVHFGKNADINDWKESKNTVSGKSVRYNDDPNSTNKRINALGETQFEQSKEMQMLKSKNPELYHKVLNEKKMLDMMRWEESHNTQGGRTPQQQITPGMTNMIGKTHNLDMFNKEYNPIFQGKTSIFAGKKSALKDPTTLGTEKNELFKDNHMSYTSAVTGKPKTLRASTSQYNDHTFNNLNGLTS
jgi:hypothetical protein